MEKTKTVNKDKDQDAKKKGIPGSVIKKCRQIIDFVKETKKELYNVSWPGRREVISTTGVVIVAVFFFGFFLFLVDFLISNGMGYILNLR